MLRLSFMGVVLVAIALTSRSVLGAPATRTTRLDYIRGPGAGDCPDGDSVRAGIAARLGYEPFDESVDGLVVAEVSRVGNRLEATIHIAEGGGRAARRLTSVKSDCVELAAAMELAIAMAIDPLGGVRPKTVASEPEALPPPPTPLPPPSPQQTTPPPITLTERAPEAPRPIAPTRPVVPLVVEATVGALGAAGIAPSASWGGTCQLSLRRNALSLGVEGRADVAATAPLRTGEIDTSIVTGALVPCVHHGFFGGCGLFSAGVLRAAGRGLQNARQVSIPFVAVGARIEVEVPLGSIAVVRIHIDGLAPLTETVLRVSGDAAWTSPALSAAIGFAVGARFP